MNLLIVADVDRTYDPRDLGAQRCEIAANIGIVRDLLRFAALPRIPVTRQCNQDSQCEQHDHKRSPKFSPARLRPRSGLSFIVLRRQLPDWCVRVCGHGGGGHQLAPWHQEIFVTAKLSWLVYAAASGTRI